MNFLKPASSSVQRLISQSLSSVQKQSVRLMPSLCDDAPLPHKPCFDLSKITIERGNQCHAKMVRSFLFTHHWPREPSVVGLWMPYKSAYLDTLTDKYAHTGDRFLAFEHEPRTKERKLVGVAIANKVFPWAADELEEWAHYTSCKPEKQRMYFIAHCYRSPNLFAKHKVDFIYEVEVLATASEVAGQGLGTALLRAVIVNSLDLRYPLIQLISTSLYTTKICQKCGMKQDWTMKYTDFIDEAGQRVFFPRRPHDIVSIFTKKFNPKDVWRKPCPE